MGSVHLDGTNQFPSYSTYVLIVVKWFPHIINIILYFIFYPSSFFCFLFIFFSTVFVGCQTTNVGAIVFNISCLLFLNYICSSSFYLFTFKISIEIIKFGDKLTTFRLSSK